MVRRTKEDALATRNQILDAAEHVFHERGVSRTSLHEIAKAAGVTRGAIYWHFADKADLFDAMMRRVIFPLEENNKRCSDPGLEDPLTFLRENFIQVLRETVDDPQRRRVFEVAIFKVEYVDELQSLRERRLDTRAECLAQVEQGLNLAIQRGQLSGRVPARVAAFGLHALIDGLLQNWMLDPERFDLVAVGQQVLDSYLAGLGGAGGTLDHAPKK